MEVMKIFDCAKICAGMFSFCNGIDMLLVNTYLPCDDRYLSSSYHEVVDILGKISCILSDQSFDVAVIGGDFNCDFSRLTPHVSAVREFLAAVDLKHCLDLNKADVKYTFECKASGSKSFN